MVTVKCGNYTLNKDNWVLPVDLAIIRAKTIAIFRYSDW